MYKRVKGPLKFWIKFWIWNKFAIHTHPPKVFIHSNPKMGEWKKEIILAKMTRTNLKPKTYFNYINQNGPKGKPTICNYSTNIHKFHN